MILRSLICLVTLVLVVETCPAQAPPPPSPEHEQMAREAGEWDAQMTTWFQPGADPQTFKAKETNTMFGAYWLVTKFECKDPEFPFTGRMQLGYDSAEKHYVGVWIDNMNPHASHMTGQFDKESNTLTMVSKGRDFSTGEKHTSTMVTEYVDEDTKVFTMYAGEPGADGKVADDAYKMMQIKYKRKK